MKSSLPSYWAGQRNSTVTIKHLLNGNSLGKSTCLRNPIQQKYQFPSINKTFRDLESHIAITTMLTRRTCRRPAESRSCLLFIVQFLAIRYDSREYPTLLLGRYSLLNSPLLPIYMCADLVIHVNKQFIPTYHSVTGSCLPAFSLTDIRTPPGGHTSPPFGAHVIHGNRLDTAF